MTTPSTLGSNSAWSLYRQCAATSAFQKNRLETFTKVSLWLGVLGAVIATLTPFIANPAMGKVLAATGAIAVALAGLAAAQATAGDRDKVWIKCRGVGEALKSSVYLYNAGVSPFDAPNRSELLAQRVEKAVSDLGGTELRPGTPKDPPGALNVDEYIKSRVDDQVERYYIPTATKYQKKADLWRFLGFAAAALSAVLGTLTTVFPISPWVALLATVTTSITAYVKNQRYQAMIGLYQATAIRLQALKSQWLDSGRSQADKADRDSFIQRCEDTMALESGAWMSQWSQQPKDPQSSSAVSGK